MSSYALYRLPGEHTYTGIRQHGEPDAFSDVAQLDATSTGFVIAPFCPSTDSPIVLIREEEVWSVECEVELVPHSAFHTPHSTLHTPPPSPQYAQAFARFHAQLQAGHFAKIVLARTEHIPCCIGARGKEQGAGGEGQEDEEALRNLFLAACARFPHLFVALVNTPQTGTWLMATPECLLERWADGRYHTMALAGTISSPHGERQEATWSEKNLAEQRYVATAIADSLKPLAQDLRTNGPKTVEAGHLLHLCTDFTFRLSAPQTVGEVISRLHPTPAVCGLPQAETLRFILQEEPTPRRYYSGFAGPWNLRGQQRLYMTLRCMEIRPTECILHAGGGLLPDSELQAEWEETEAKMAAMRSLLPLAFCSSPHAPRP